MENRIFNSFNSERIVEVLFICEILKKYFEGQKLLDVGGIPTNHSFNSSIYETIKNLNIQHDIADFRGGKYSGDFVTIKIDESYDFIMFLSSLEHFPQCTEGDLIFRDNEDRKGYLKALSILKDKGKIILTIPFGKFRWQPYHQNYDLEAIMRLTEGSKIIESYTYKLSGDNYWELTDPKLMGEVLYTDKAYGVGCFLLEKL
jgi:hypothetical protein